MTENNELTSVPMFLIGLVEDLALTNGLSIDEMHQTILDDRASVVTTGQLESAVEWLLNGTKKPWLALEFGRRINYQQLGVFGPLIASCRTVKVALSLFHRYQMLLHPLFGLTHEVVGKKLCLRYSMMNQLPSNIFYAEAILGAVPVWGERLTGKKLDIHEIWFRHSEPSYSDKYREHFQCEILFDQVYDALWVDAHMLDLPILSASPSYHSKIKAQAQQQLQSLETIGAEIKRIILISLPVDINIEMVAKALHCSERTIQRKLADEKTNFKEIKQEVRKIVAIDLLETTSLSMEQIAFRLGYEQRNSFAVAFKRWTGVKPKDWPR